LVCLTMSPGAMSPSPIPSFITKTDPF
jgi:hypothetical protein